MPDVAGTRPLAESDLGDERRDDAMGLAGYRVPLGEVTRVGRGLVELRPCGRERLAVEACPDVADVPELTILVDTE